MNINSKLTAYLLPTEDASHIFVSSTGMLLFDKTRKKSSDNHHLYLTSDATIKEGDWCIGNNNDVHKYDGIKYKKEWCKKIEFTTDPKLIADGVTAIDGNTKASFVCPICEGVGFTIKGYTMDCENCKGKKNIEVNFLTEFCKRWNEKDNEVIIPSSDEDWNDIIKNSPKGIKTAAEMTVWLRKEYNAPVKRNPKDSQKADVEKLALEEFKKIDDGYLSYDGFIKGFKSSQALQSQAGGFSLEFVKNALSEAFKASNEGYPITADEIIQSLTKSQPKGDGFCRCQTPNVDSRDTFSRCNICHNPVSYIQPKGDIVIECEMEEHLINKNGNEPRNDDDVKGSIYKIKLKDGQPIFYFK